MEPWWNTSGIDYIIAKYDFAKTKSRAFKPEGLIQHLQSKSSCPLHYGVAVYVDELYVNNPPNDI